jgi:hypothetical protein
MICYKGQSFCASDCTNAQCWRYVLEGTNTNGLPVDFAEHHHNCPDYKPPVTKDRE